MELDQGRIHTLPKLSVPINLQLTLYAGDYEPTERGWHITPPVLPLFYQLKDYLLNQPRPPYFGIGYSVNTIGAVSLCIRYGSYLCTLLDPNAPHRLSVAGASRQQPPEQSFITNGEMHRLNLEISWNFQQLIDLFQANQTDYYDLLARAYAYLPHLRKNTNSNRGDKLYLDALLVAFATGYLDIALAPLPEPATRAAANLIAVQA